MRLMCLHLDTSEVTLVTDKGPLSEDNLAKVREWIHVVAALPASMPSDLMDLDLDRFSPLHTTGKGHELLGYLTRRELYGEEWKVEVTYNAATAQRKAAAYARYETKFLEGMAKLKEGYARTKGRQLSYPRAGEWAARLIPSATWEPSVTNSPRTRSELVMGWTRRNARCCAIGRAGGCSAPTSIWMRRGWRGPTRNGRRSERISSG